MRAERVGRQFAIAILYGCAQNAVKFDEIFRRSDLCCQQSQPSSVLELAQHRTREIWKDLCLHHIEELLPLVRYSRHERSVQSRRESAHEDPPEQAIPTQARCR